MESRSLVSKRRFGEGCDYQGATLHGLGLLCILIVVVITQIYTCNNASVKIYMYMQMNACTTDEIRIRSGIVLM